MKDYSNTIDTKYLHSEITGKILQGFYLIMNKIGYGFGVEILKKALIVELEFLGLKCELDKPVELIYRNEKIGAFRFDILINNKVSLLIISEENILRKHEVTLSNQLENSDIEVGLLLNAHVEGSHKRNFYSNSLKDKKNERLAKN